MKCVQKHIKIDKLQREINVSIARRELDVVFKKYCKYVLWVNVFSLVFLQQLRQRSTLFFYDSLNEWSIFFSLFLS